MKWLSKVLLSIIMVLVCLIIINFNYGELLKKYIYEANIHFYSFNDLFSKFTIKKDDVMTFNENFIYLSREKIDDYYKLKVDKNYLVNVIKPGIIVYIGNKDNFGNTVIVQGIDGVDLWYGNISNVNYSLYDYVTSSDVLGEVNDDIMYLKIISNGKILTYEEYIR